MVGQHGRFLQYLTFISFLEVGKHRGFAFITFTSSADAQDAIDNMDLNELQGKVVKVNLARPMKGPIQPLGNRAGGCLPHILYRSIYSRRSLGIRRMATRICQTFGTKWRYVVMLDYSTTPQILFRRSRSKCQKRHQPNRWRTGPRSRARWGDGRSLTWDSW